MAFREVAVTEIREVLRAWLAGAGLRRVAAQAGVDRKTARRYVEAAVEAGLARDGGAGQLTDELVGQVAQVVRPVRPGGHGRGGSGWRPAMPRSRRGSKDGLTVVKIGELLERRGIVVPVSDAAPVLRRAVRLSAAPPTTVRVADGEPGAGVPARLRLPGHAVRPGDGRQRKVHALIFTAC